MAKVKNPNPKVFKKDVLEKRKLPKVKTKENSSKEKIKKIEKSPRNVKNKIVEDANINSAELNTKLKRQNDVKKSPSKKKTCVVQVHESVKEVKHKKPPIDAEFQHGKTKKMCEKKSIFASTGKKKIAVEKKPLGGEVKIKKSFGAKGKKTSFCEKVERKNSLGSESRKKTLVEKKSLSRKKIEKENSSARAVENENYHNDCKEQKERKEVESDIFQPVKFNEEKFKEIVSAENIKKILTALRNLVAKELSERKTAIFDDYNYFLNVSSYKIPQCPKRMVKLNLKHSLVDIETGNVVMIVPDLQRGAKVDYEPTVQHYEDILREFNMGYIKIVPFNQLRNEFATFEAKIKFANSYDYFLCDGRIVGPVVGFCGKHFQRPRTAIHAVHLKDPTKYKIAIEKALCRTSFRQLKKGDLISICIGNHRFTIDKLEENVQEVIKQLEKIFPGGYANIRNLYVKIDIKGTSSLPLYVNLAGAPDDVPNIIGPREKRMIKLKKEANNILSKFSMSKTGEFIKLNKTQIQRKQKIRKALGGLFSKENIAVNENVSECDPPPNKKVKKDEQKTLKHTNDNGNNNTHREEIEDGSENTHGEESEDANDNTNQEESEDGSDDTNQEDSEVSDEE